MKRLLSIAMVSLLFCVDTFAQNPTRKVLYTLAPNEAIVGDEHFVQFQADGYRFALVLVNTDTEQNTLVFNGKRIPYGRIIKREHETGHIPAIANGDNCLGYIDLNDPNGYILYCTIKSKGHDGSDQKEYWVNRGGKMEGPYEYVWFDEDDVELKSKTYHYVLADRVYDNIEGKVSPSKGIFKMSGWYHPKEGDHTYISVNGTIKAFPGYGDVYINGDNYIVKTGESLYFNGKLVNYVKHISDVVLNGKGDYAYIYSDALPSSSSYKGCYIVKNGVKLNTDPYKWVRALYLTENGDVAYRSDHKIHLPGTEIHLHEIAGIADTHQIGFIYRDGGQYAYSYSDGNGSWYVKTDKTEFGPYSEVHTSSYFGTYVDLAYDGKHCAFSYKKGDNWYVRTDKTEFGPYNNYVDDIKFVENGDCYYKINHRRYCNGKKLEESEESEEGEGKGLDVDGHNFYFNYGYDYVVIDGQRFGKAAPFEYRYDKEKNAFVWYCIEGRESESKKLVIYEYALD